MPRLSPEKRAELEAFWWAHHEAWKGSDLNQREYCKVNDLPLKRFGNWCAQFRREPRPELLDLLYRRGGLSHSFSHKLSHMTKGMTERNISSPQRIPLKILQRMHRVITRESRRGKSGPVRPNLPGSKSSKAGTQRYAAPGVPH